MKYNSERTFESYIRNLIQLHIASKNKKIHLLESKKAVDIVICRNTIPPHLYFLEVKYHINGHGRLGFGSKGGGGFQPEILSKRPHYFENNLRWVIASEHSDRIHFLNNEVLLNFISGGSIGKKFNNIQKKLFAHQEGLTEIQFVSALKRWILAK
jgi:hypothetical protein